MAAFFADGDASAPPSPEPTAQGTHEFDAPVAALSEALFSFDAASAPPSPEPIRRAAPPGARVAGSENATGFCVALFWAAAGGSRRSSRWRWLRRRSLLLLDVSRPHAARALDLDLARAWALAPLLRRALVSRAREAASQCHGGCRGRVERRARAAPGRRRRRWRVRDAVADGRARRVFACHRRARRRGAELSGTPVLHPTVKRFRTSRRAMTRRPVSIPIAGALRAGRALRRVAALAAGAGVLFVVGGYVIEISTLETGDDDAAIDDAAALMLVSRGAATLAVCGGALLATVALAGSRASFAVARREERRAQGVGRRPPRRSRRRRRMHRPSCGLAAAARRAARAVGPWLRCARLAAPSPPARPRAAACRARHAAAAAEAAEHLARRDDAPWHFYAAPPTAADAARPPPRPWPTRARRAARSRDCSSSAGAAGCRGRRRRACSSRRR